MHVKMLACTLLTLPGTTIEVPLANSAGRYLRGEWSEDERVNLSKWHSRWTNQWFSSLLNQLAQEFGKFLADEMLTSSSIVVSDKGSATDVVTSIDKGIETILEGWIQREFPTHSIIGEESLKEGRVIRDPNHIWFIDPVDGTKNWLMNRLDVGVTFCLVRNQMPYASVVYVPRAGKLYYSNLTGAYVLDFLTHSTRSLQPKSFDPENLVIGTEHSRESKRRDEIFLHQLTDHLAEAGIHSGEDRVIGSMSHGA